MTTYFQPLTITMPKPFYQRVKKEASRRQTSVSELLRDSFTFFTETSPDIYSDAELDQLLKKDVLPKKLKRDLDRLLKR